MSCGRCENGQVGGRQEFDCRRCENGQVGGTQEFACRRELNKLKRDIDALERCLLAAAEEENDTTPSRRCRCRCWCCCCCRSNGSVLGNQTSWGR